MFVRNAVGSVTHYFHAVILSALQNAPKVLVADFGSNNFGDAMGIQISKAMGKPPLDTFHLENNMFSEEVKDVLRREWHQAGKLSGRNSLRGLFL